MAFYSMEITNTEIEKRLTEIIVEIFPEMAAFITEYRDNDGYSVLSEIDSIQMLEVMAALELEFNIFFDEADLNIELFNDLQSLSEFIRQKYTHN